MVGFFLASAAVWRRVALGAWPATAQVTSPGDRRERQGGLHGLLRVSAACPRTHKRTGWWRVRAPIFRCLRRNCQVFRLQGVEASGRLLSWTAAEAGGIPAPGHGTV